MRYLPNMIGLFIPMDEVIAKVLANNTSRVAMVMMAMRNGRWRLRLGESDSDSRMSGAMQLSEHDVELAGTGSSVANIISS